MAQSKYSSFSTLQEVPLINLSNIKNSGPHWCWWSPVTNLVPHLFSWSVMSEAETSELQNLQINFRLEQSVFWKQDKIKTSERVAEWRLYQVARMLEKRSQKSCLLPKCRTQDHGFDSPRRRLPLSVFNLATMKPCILCTVHMPILSLLEFNHSVVALHVDCLSMVLSLQKLRPRANI